MLIAFILSVLLIVAGVVMAQLQGRGLIAIDSLPAISCGLGVVIALMCFGGLLF